MKDRLDAERFRAEICASPPALRASPTVSVLVAAWNEARGIEQHVESALAVRGSSAEIEVVVCAGGPDGTYDRTKRFEREGVVVLEQRTGEGKQRALRRAYERSTGEIIYLTDADCALDDRAVRHLLAPLVNDGEPAAAGVSVPPRAQIESNTFVAYQYAIQLFGDAHAPRYVAGILGRNAAVTRDALERAGGFDAEVPSGTDYHLAKALLASGSRIRHVPASRVTTPYAATWPGYVRQQRRWLRNVALLGARSGAWSEAAASLRTSAVGAAMISGPLAALLAAYRWPAAGKAAMAGWLMACAAAVQAKLRYLAFARVADEVPRVPVATVCGYTLLEFAAWAAPLLDYASGARRQRW